MKIALATPENDPLTHGYNQETKSWDDDEEDNFGASGCSNWYEGPDDVEFQYKKDGSDNWQYEDYQKYKANSPIVVLCWLMLGNLVSLLVSGLWYYWDQIKLGLGMELFQ